MKYFIHNQNDRCYLAYNNIININKQKLKAKNESFAVLDFETNQDNEVVEAGIVLFSIKENNIVVEYIFQNLYQPNNFNTKKFNFLKFSKLRKSHLQFQSKFFVKYNFEKINELLKNRTIITFDSKKEEEILSHIYKHFYNKKPTYNYLDLSKVKEIIEFKKTNELCLEKLAKHFKLWEPIVDAKNWFHTALFDCSIIFKLFLSLNTKK